MVYCSYTFQLLNTFTGHIGPVRRIAWAPNDLSIFSAGVDGNVYGWELTSGARIEEVSQLNQSIAYSGLAVSSVG